MNPHTPCYNNDHCETGGIAVVNAVNENSGRSFQPLVLPR